MPHNPLNVSVGSDVQAGTSDQYPVGDLSSKFGQLTGFSVIHSVFNDTNMPLYGATSIVGRSFVLNRAVDNERYIQFLWRLFFITVFGLIHLLITF